MSPDPMEGLTINDLAARFREAMLDLMHETTVEPEEARGRVSAEMVKLQPYLEYFGKIDVRRQTAERRLETAIFQHDVMFKRIFLDAHAGLSLQMLIIMVHEHLELIKRALNDS